MSEEEIGEETADEESTQEQHLILLVRLVRTCLRNPLAGKSMTQAAIRSVQTVL